VHAGVELGKNDSMADATFSNFEELRKLIARLGSK
jgi:hypothetical protein